MGRIHAGAGRPQRAINQFEKELAINPADGVALTSVGAIYFNSGQLSIAADRLRRAVAASPDSARAHSLLAEVLFRQSSYEEGLEHQSQALQLGRSDLGLLLNHARALHNYGHAEESAPVSRA